MEQSELLHLVVEALERMGLDYFVTGSLATIYYGEPRFTNDIDVVVRLPAQRISEFCRQFPPATFYVSEEAARQAVRAGSLFNILHPESGLKADIITPTDDAFTHSEFARKVRREADPQLSFDAMFASPEDVIIKKMDFYREGGSEKHLRDIASVLKVRGRQIDHDYIAKWAAAMGLTSIWKMILSRVGRISG